MPYQKETIQTLWRAHIDASHLRSSQKTLRFSKNTVGAQLDVKNVAKIVFGQLVDLLPGGSNATTLINLVIDTADENHRKRYVEQYNNRLKRANKIRGESPDRREVSKVLSTEVSLISLEKLMRDVTKCCECIVDLRNVANKGKRIVDPGSNPGMSFHPKDIRDRQKKQWVKDREGCMIAKEIALRYYRSAIRLRKLGISARAMHRISSDILIWLEMEECSLRKVRKDIFNMVDKLVASHNSGAHDQNLSRNKCIHEALQQYVYVPPLSKYVGDLEKNPSTRNAKPMSSNTKKVVSLMEKDKTIPDIVHHPGSIRFTPYRLDHDEELDSKNFDTENLKKICDTCSVKKATNKKTQKHPPPPGTRGDQTDWASLKQWIDEHQWT